jgi:hypothetical protein
VDPRATLIILDGARPDVFADLAGRGDLPNIGRHLLETGGITAATTVFPSTTGVAYLPFLTGCYPGTCDVPGIRWLDPLRYGGRWWRDRDHVRSYCGPQGPRLGTDLPAGVPSLFDIEEDSVALCTPFSRGLGRSRIRAGGARSLWGGLAHYTGRYGPLERAVGRELIRLAPRRHRLTFAVFPGIDGVTHFHDPWHPAVLDVYRAFDRVFGRFVAASGMDGDALTMLVSDHGLSTVDRHTDVALELEGLGVPVLRHPLVWRRSPKAAVMVSGNGSAHVYLRPGEPRRRRYSASQIEAGEVTGIPGETIRFLAALPGIAFVAATEGDHLVLYTRAARSRLTDHGDGLIHYDPGDGDTLGLGGPATRHEREWLRASYDGNFPDAPMQLLQLFRTRRTGDLVVVAAPGADLRHAWEIPEHRAGHGSLHGEHMRCLVAANRSWQGPLRTTDLFPVILDHLGHEPLPGIDGRLPARAEVSRPDRDAPPAAAGPPGP